MSRDNPAKLLEDPQSLNLYAYARNNPLKYVDPSGEVSIAAAERFFDSQFEATMAWGDFLTLGQYSQAFNNAAEAGQKIHDEGLNLETGANLAKTVAGDTLKIGSTALAEGLTIGEGMSAARLYTATKAVDKGAGSGPENLYHYTNEKNAASIAKTGLNLRKNDFIYATTKKNLTPTQAQIELALKPNNPPRTVIFEIDTKKMKEAGINYIMGPRPVTGGHFGAGGGTEVLYNKPIGPEYLRRIK